MAHQGYDESVLRQWFPETEEGTARVLDEIDIRGIAEILARGTEKSWSRIPRIYSVLRKIDQLHTIQAFIDNGITDIAFPFTRKTLPEALCDHSVRLKFLELQHLVYNSEALHVEQKAIHGHFKEPTDVPLKRIGDLGKGGFGYVDHVVSTFSNKEYARKLISRGTTFRKDKQVQQAFVNELASLKRLSHPHLVTLVGSYTDRKYVALVMSPVADCNLEVLLDKCDGHQTTYPFLRSFFGCIASAIGYLHDNSIRHKDIKPSNILVKHDQVYVTDFGTCLDWSELENSTTETAPPTTLRYCPPEVVARVKRNSTADMWSLGCVFLEMWTAVRLHTVTELRAHLSSSGSHTTNYYSNLESCWDWIELLDSRPCPTGDNLPSIWIKSLLKHAPNQRWSVHVLEDRIRESSLDPSAKFMYVGLCCLDDGGDTSDASTSSEVHDEINHLDLANESFSRLNVSGPAMPSSNSPEHFRGQNEVVIPARIKNDISNAPQILQRDPHKRFPLYDNGKEKTLWKKYNRTPKKKKERKVSTYSGFKSRFEQPSPGEILSLEVERRASLKSAPGWRVTENMLNCKPRNRGQNMSNKPDTLMEFTKSPTAHMGRHPRFPYLASPISGSQTIYTKEQVRTSYAVNPWSWWAWPGNMPSPPQLFDGQATSPGSLNRNALTLHWAIKVFGGRHPLNPLGHSDDNTICLARDESRAIQMLYETGFDKIIEIYLDEAVSVHLYWRFHDGRARILYVTMDASKKRMHNCLPLTALKILRRGPCLLFYRMKRQDERLDLWAKLRFLHYEQMTLFYCTTVAMKHQDQTENLAELEDDFSADEKMEFEW